MSRNLRYIYHNCKNIVYHKNLENNQLYTKYNINVSTYIPKIIRNIINSIDNKYNKLYIICPFYNNLFNYQIGITETGKVGETTYETVIRGINEECGLSNIVWCYNNMYTFKQNNKEWFGVCINNNKCIYNPKNIINNNKDNPTNKTAAIIYNNIDNLLKTYNNVIKDDIKTDNISGLGFISIYDCKQILKRI